MHRELYDRWMNSKTSKEYSPTPLSKELNKMTWDRDLKRVVYKPILNTRRVIRLTPQERLVEETHMCKSCNEVMNHTNFLEGKMCCDRPLFGDDYVEEEEE
jgi:hypothetical protein